MPQHEFLARHSGVSQEKPESAEKLFNEAWSALKERINHLRSPFELVQAQDVIEAAEEGGNKERRLEELNPVIKYYVSQAKIMQKISALLDYTEKTSNLDRIKDVKKMWERFEKSEIQPIQDLKAGILHQTTAMHLLRNQGFQIYFPKPIEDVFGGVDYYGTHPQSSQIFLFQVKANREGTRPIAAKIKEEEIGLPKDASFKTLRKFSNHLSQRYQNEFQPIAFFVPRPAQEPKINPLTGKPSQKYLDKFNNIVVL